MLTILRPAILASLLLIQGALVGRAEEVVVLQGPKLEVRCTLAGGAIVSARLGNSAVNPLNWEVPDDLATRAPQPAAPRGHFVCFDRWGAPSEAEGRRGMPFHGEAPYAQWTLDSPPAHRNDVISTQMSCQLPVAGLRMVRTIELDARGTSFKVIERVTNTARLGRVYNLVQHPTIAPPFLDADTLVDTNAREGFSQDLPPMNGRDNVSPWPKMPLRGAVRDLRQLETGDEPEAISDVCSFVFEPDAEWGWVTAASPSQGVLLGYVWRLADYPWLNIWRYRQGNKRLARGLEFGTTGYHQPFPVLVKTGRLLDRATYEFLDADETTERPYLGFLAEIPRDFQGVERLDIEEESLRLHERRSQSPRTIVVPSRLTLAK